MDKKTIEGLSDKELALKYARAKDLAKYYDILKEEIKARFKDKGSVKGVEKKVYRVKLAWINKEPLLKKKGFWEKVVISVSDAKKKGLLKEPEKVKGQKAAEANLAFVELNKDLVIARSEYSYIPNLSVFEGEDEPLQAQASATPTEVKPAKVKEVSDDIFNY